MSSHENHFKSLVQLDNLLYPSDAIWRHGSGSALVQVMVCCLMVPSNYLNQCWLIMREALSHTPWHNQVTPVYRGWLYVFVPVRTAPAPLQAADSCSRNNHGWPSTQPGSLHTALQRKYTQPCSLFSCGTAVWTMGERLCASARLCRGSPVNNFWTTFRISFILARLLALTCTLPN